MQSGEPTWKEAAALVMALTGDRSQEPAKTIFKNQFDSFLCYDQHFCFIKLYQKELSVVKIKWFMCMLIMDWACNPLRNLF